MMMSGDFQNRKKFILSFQHTHCLGNKYMLDIKIIKKTPPFLQNIPHVFVLVHVR